MKFLILGWHSKNMQKSNYKRTFDVEDWAMESSVFVLHKNSVVHKRKILSQDND